MTSHCRRDRTLTPYSEIPEVQASLWYSLPMTSEQWRWTVIKCWVLVWFYLWLLLENGRALEGSVCPLTLHPKVFRESTVQHHQGLTVGCYFASSQGTSGRIRGALGTERSVRSGQRVGNTSFVGGWSLGLCFLGPCRSHIFISPRCLVFFLFKQAWWNPPFPSARSQGEWEGSEWCWALLLEGAGCELWALWLTWGLPGTCYFFSAWLPVFFSFKENWGMSALRVSSRARWVQFQEWGSWVVHCSDFAARAGWCPLAFILSCMLAWVTPALCYTWLPSSIIVSALSEKGSSVIQLCFSHNHGRCFSVSWEKLYDPREPSPVLKEGATEHLGTRNY